MAKSAFFECLKLGNLTFCGKRAVRKIVESVKSLKLSGYGNKSAGQIAIRGTAYPL